ncbi:MAG: FtsW/RodA/SpoVE family cell cycle protein [Anaerolineales bacterium]|nr:FtsW/RodA/SpoVE family cell cycle protein [Anaerolineales bacterium]MDW8160543.1 FtsW/RodA/SpoVE family cell cycle protein [Anaerolineales bacterium]
MKPEINVVVQRERQLLFIALGVVFLFGLALNLATIVRSGALALDRAQQVGLGFLAWAACLGVTWRVARVAVPERDPYLLPTAFLLIGWGLMTLWRLSPYHAQRQTLWLAVSSLLLTLILKAPSDLVYLKRYKYLWLSGGLLLVFATLIFGTNPAGSGLPRLWLGCCGVYLQPSEPMKLFLIVYLAAYLAGSQPLLQKAMDSKQLIALLAPSGVMSLLAMGLLIVQQDLGTASIFFFLSAVLFYFATERRSILLFGALGIILGLGIGYALFDVVRWRVEAWVNPYLDPTHRSYQIVQSLIAIANGGLFGRGLGLGYPEQVPVPHSDFIYAAIMEETGLIGSIALLGCLALLTLRAILTAMRNQDRFQRLLAIGIAAYFGGQSILIIGGNLRLLPLTGVTLPFLSYGGSSLVVSGIMLGLLLQISHSAQPQPGILPNPKPYLAFGALLLLGYFSVALASGWFALVRAPILLARTDNARRYIYEQLVQRGTIFDRELRPLAVSEREGQYYRRRVLYPPLSPLIGYSHPVFGQSGLERSLDVWLSGERGYRTSAILWQRLLTGTPPPGIAVRLTLDLEFQREVDQLLSGKVGAAVVVNARSGDLLALASQPAYDANQLSANIEIYLKDPNTPLLNRPFQGRYAINRLNSLLFSKGIAALRFGELRALGLPEGLVEGVAVQDDVRVTPLQAVCAAAALANGGQRVPLRVLDAFHLPESGWVSVQPESTPLTVYRAEEIEALLKDRNSFEGLMWSQTERIVSSGELSTSWFVGGTTSNWRGDPLAVVLVLEGEDEETARSIGGALLEAAMLKVD